MLRLWFLFNGIIYLLLGAAFLFIPEKVLMNMGVQANTASGLTELVTVYGGLEAGMGILLLISSIRFWLGDFALNVLIFTYLSFFSGRVIAILLYGVSDNISWYLLVFEGAAALISAALKKKQKSSVFY